MGGDLSPVSEEGFLITLISVSLFVEGLVKVEGNFGKKMREKSP